MTAWCICGASWIRWTGAKVRKRFLQEAERLRRCDLKSPGGEKRSLSQRLADALDTLTATSTVEGNHGTPSADVAIVQHLSPDGDRAFAEVAGGGVIPPSVLEEHFCNARIVGIVYSSKGVPLWRGPALAAAHQGPDGCAHCPLRRMPGMRRGTTRCARPITSEPRSQGGPTDIDNLMLLCWGCHDKVHHHGWRVVPSGRPAHHRAPGENPSRPSPRSRPAADQRPAQTAAPRRFVQSPAQGAQCRRPNRSSRSPRTEMHWRDAAEQAEAGLATIAIPSVASIRQVAAMNAAVDAKGGRDKKCGCNPE